MSKNGVVSEITVNTRKAADGRHQPFITSVNLPATHPALPEGTILIDGAEAGTAALAAASGIQSLLGVLEEAVEADEPVGNVLIHGSCPAEILVTVVANGTATAALPALVKGLRAIGIYV
ncbi:MAG: hypothetical protein LBD09_05600 [Treponema sp.]|jgi:hypothetical protein|nr:hypothetical protein [Treponema sp.]